MHWTLPALRRLSLNEYAVLVQWLTDQQRAAAGDDDVPDAEGAYGR